MTRQPLFAPNGPPRCKSIKVGERVHDGSEEYECCGGNDLCVPYFKRINRRGKAVGKPLVLFISRELYLER